MTEDRRELKDMLQQYQAETVSKRNQIKALEHRVRDLESDSGTLERAIELLEQTEQTPAPGPDLGAAQPASNGETDGVALGKLPEGRQTFDTAEVARYLGVTESRVQQLRKGGRLKHKRELGGQIRHSRASLEALYAERQASN